MLLLCMQVVWFVSGCWWIAAGAANGLEFEDSDVEQEPAPTTPKGRGTAAAKACPSSGEKPRAAPKRSCKGRHKSGGKGGARTCKSCHRSKPADEYALNQANCRMCKAALDNIWKKAKAQKRVPWLEGVLQDADDTKHMLASYAAAMAAAGNNKGPRKEAWSITRYIETVKSTTKTKKTGRNQLMWREQAIEFWKSLPGGGLSHTMADSKWTMMESTYLESGLDYDNEGPDGASLRLAVRVADFVDDSTSVSKSKQQPQLLV